MVSAAGVATHFVPHASIATVKDALLSMQHTITPATVSQLIHQLVPESNANFESELATLRKHVDGTFDKGSVEDIVQALKQDNSEWAQKTLKTLHTVSPTSLKVVYNQIKIGSKLAFDKCFDLELTIAAQMMV